MKKPREAVGANSVKGRVRGVQEGQKQGGRKVSAGETVVMEQGGKVGEIGEGDREKARTRVDKVIFIEFNLLTSTSQS